ncbi:hypothetical protein ADK76_37030 [Streptomyces griseoflavus]|nr:hypothetical protein ADK76_37030 [Streptomyces griseoflavus]
MVMHVGIHTVRVPHMQEEPGGTVAGLRKRQLDETVRMNDGLRLARRNEPLDKALFQGCQQGDTAQFLADIPRAREHARS